MDNLSNLPNEVLEEIFQHCQLLPLLLVSKKFNEVISGSPRLMSKFRLIFSDKSDPLEIVKSNRKYQGVSFNFNFKINEGCLQVFNKFSIKTLRFVRSIIDARLFYSCLESLPELETLFIRATYLKNKENFCLNEAPLLLKLKNFNFANSDVGFLHYLQNAPIEKFVSSAAAHYPSSSIPNFLREHPSITMVDISVGNKLSADLLTCLSRQMTNLKQLNIHCGISEEELRGLELINTTVQHLIVYSESEANSLIFIVGIFKNIKIFELQSITLNQEKLLQLPQQLPDITSFTVTDCSGDYFNYIDFRNLKELRLGEGGHSDEEWRRLAMRNADIEKIVISDESITSAIFRTICLEFRKLKHFEMFYDPQRLEVDILDFVCSWNLPNIR